MSTTVTPAYNIACNAIDSNNKKLYYQGPDRSGDIGTMMGGGVVSFLSIIPACTILSIAMTMSDSQTKNTLKYVAGTIFIIATIMSMYYTFWAETPSTYFYGCHDDNRKDNEYRRI